MSDSSERKKKLILGRTHTPAVVQGGGGGGQIEPLPGVFYVFDFSFGAKPVFIFSTR